MRLSCPVLLILTALMAAPLAAAAEPIEGRLSFPEGAHLGGDAVLSASVGALDLAPAARAGDALTLSWASAAGFTVHHTFTFVGPGAPAVGAGETTGNESFTMGAGELESLQCFEGCVALLLSGDEGGTLRLAGAADAPAAWLREPLTFAGLLPTNNREDNFVYRAEAGWLKAGPAGADSLPLPEATAEGAGVLHLFLWNATMTFVEEGERQEISTTREETPTAGPGGVQTGSEVSRRYVVMRLEGAKLSSPAPSHAALLAPRASVVLEGRLRAPEAVGTLEVGGQRWTLDGESLQVLGSLALELEAEPAGLEGVAAPGAWDDATLGARLEGTAREVLVAGAPLEAGAGSVAWAAGTGGLALLLAGVLFVLGKAGYLPFYMRVEKAALLENPTRRTIYEALRHQPGASVTELSRGTGTPQSVVRHHLRILIAHQYVVKKDEGKVKAYFLQDGTLRPGFAKAHVVLKDATRRRIAHLVARAPAGLTQRELVQSTGLSQRMVSHHLRRLREERLVAVLGFMPQRYAPTALLADFATEASLLDASVPDPGATSGA